MYCQKLFHDFLKQCKAQKLSRTLMPNQTALLAFMRQNLGEFGAGLKCLFSDWPGIVHHQRWSRKDWLWCLGLGAMLLYAGEPPSYWRTQLYEENLYPVVPVWDWPNYRSLWRGNRESSSGNCGRCQQTPGIWWDHVGMKALESTVPFPWAEKWNRANPTDNQEINLPVFSQKNNNILLGEQGWTSFSLKMFKLYSKGFQFPLLLPLYWIYWIRHSPTGLRTLHLQRTEDAKPVRTYPLISKAMRK